MSVDGKCKLCFISKDIIKANRIVNMIMVVFWSQIYSKYNKDYELLW